MDPTPAPRDFVMPLGVFIMKDENGHVFQPHEGFRKYDVTSEAFKAQYAVVCSAEGLEQLFLALARTCFSETVYAIIEYYSTGEKETSQLESYLSPFIEIATVVAVFKSYMFQLNNDGQVAFGLAWQEGKRREEVFIDDHKVITVMTSQVHTVAGLLLDAGLTESEGLEFVSQHAHGHLNLTAVANLGADSDLAKVIGTREAGYVHDIIKKLNMKRQ